MPSFCRLEENVFYVRSHQACSTFTVRCSTARSVLRSDFLSFPLPACIFYGAFHDFCADHRSVLFVFVLPLHCGLRYVLRFFVAVTFVTGPHLLFTWIFCVLLYYTEFPLLDGRCLRLFDVLCDSRSALLECLLRSRVRSVLRFAVLFSHLSVWVAASFMPFLRGAPRSLHVRYLEEFWAFISRFRSDVVLRSGDTTLRCLPPTCVTDYYTTGGIVTAVYRSAMISVPLLIVFHRFCSFSRFWKSSGGSPCSRCSRSWVRFSFYYCSCLRFVPAVYSFGVSFGRRLLLYSPFDHRYWSHLFGVCYFIRATMAYMGCLGPPFQHSVLPFSTTHHTLLGVHARFR